MLKMPLIPTRCTKSIWSMHTLQFVCSNSGWCINIKYYRRLVKSWLWLVFFPRLCHRPSVWSCSQVWSPQWICLHLSFYLDFSCIFQSFEFRFLCLLYLWIVPFYYLFVFWYFSVLLWKSVASWVFLWWLLGLSVAGCHSPASPLTSVYK